MASDQQDAAALLSPNQRPITVIHQTPSIPFEKKYTFIKALGSGGEADCDRYDVEYKAFAVKTVIRPNPHTNHLHEADILASVPPHPRLPPLIEVFQRRPLRIVMPLYSGGDLTTLLQKFTRFCIKFPEAYAWHLFLQIVEGLHHLHTNDVLPLLHRDLKPENVLIDLTDSSQLFDDIKIIDFGMASAQLEPHTHPGGTPRYQPPESPQASKAADVYAVGACIYFMLTGKAPKPQCPDDIQDHARHVWYSKAPPLIQRLVDSSHTDFSPDKQPLSYSEASRATYEHSTPLPQKGYSPLLEYWVGRALDPDHTRRATTIELLSGMKADAERQIDFYKKWIPVSGKRPMCGCAYPEPPAGWRPE